MDGWISGSVDWLVNGYVQWQVRRAIAFSLAKFLGHQLAPYRGHIGPRAAMEHFYPHSLIAALKDACAHDRDGLTRHYAKVALDATGQ